MELVVTFTERVSGTPNTKKVDIELQLEARGLEIAFTVDFLLKQEERKNNTFGSPSD